MAFIIDARELRRKLKYLYTRYTQVRVKDVKSPDGRWTWEALFLRDGRSIVIREDGYYVYPETSDDPLGLEGFKYETVEALIKGLEDPREAGGLMKGVVPQRPKDSRKK